MHQYGHCCTGMGIAAREWALMHAFAFYNGGLHSLFFMHQWLLHECAQRSAIDIEAWKTSYADTLWRDFLTSAPLFCYGCLSHRFAFNAFALQSHLRCMHASCVVCMLFTLQQVYLCHRHFALYARFLRCVHAFCWNIMSQCSYSVIENSGQCACLLVSS